MISRLIFRKKNILFIALLGLLHMSLFSQQLTLKGQIKDDTSQEVIPYSTVQNINEETGVFADSLGIFVLPLKKLPTRLVLSSVGYQNDTIIVKNWSSNFSFFLQKDSNQLPTVEIVARQKLKAINDQTYLQISLSFHKIHIDLAFTFYF